jgi:hypothetical protein
VLQKGDMPAASRKNITTEDTEGTEEKRTTVKNCANKAKPGVWQAGRVATVEKAENLTTAGTEERRGAEKKCANEANHGGREVG